MEGNLASNHPVNFEKGRLMFITQGTRQNRLHGFRRAFAARLLSLLLLLALPAGVQAQFTYTTNNDGSLNISHYSQYSGYGTVIIPNTANGLLVTSIGASAFYDLPLASVTVGTNVTIIGNYAFEDCYNLTSVSMPNSVTSIGNGAFEFCNELKSITIPNSVTNIGDEAFYDCFILTNITLGNSVTTIGNHYCPGVERQDRWKVKC